MRDRRTDQRVPCLFITQAILLNTPRHTAIDIECINMSKGGLAFRGNVCVQAGDRIAINMQFCNRDGQVLLCEVRHCDEEPTGHRVGVQILESITSRQGQFDIPDRWLGQP